MRRCFSLLCHVIGSCDRMKTSPYFLMIVNALLAIGLTVISFQYIQPKNCDSFCDGSRTCPNGACAYGEQKAGWPIPAFVDNPGGGSPTAGWGRLGPEDPPLGIPMIQNVLQPSGLDCFVHHSVLALSGPTRKAFLDIVAAECFDGSYLMVLLLYFRIRFRLQHYWLRLSRIG